MSSTRNNLIALGLVAVGAGIAAIAYKRYQQANDNLPPPPAPPRLVRANGQVFATGEEVRRLQRQEELMRSCIL